MDKPLLSDRQARMLTLFADGFSAKEVAALMGLSHGTVRNYMYVISGKLNTIGRTASVAKALRRGLIR